MKLYLLVSGCIVLIWIMACTFLGTYQAESDGYLEIGFPFIFYRLFNGKCIECLEVGFFFKPFFLDVLIILTFTFVILRTTTYRAKK